MGLDVYLYEFGQVDTAAIVELSRFCDQIWADAWQEHGKTFPWPTDAAREELAKRSRKKASELGLPDTIVDDAVYGGRPVCFPSLRYPQCCMKVGEWEAGFSHVAGVIRAVTGQDIYDLFPEAQGGPEFVKPDWRRARTRLSEMLAGFKQRGPHSPAFTAVARGTSEEEKQEEFDEYTAEIGVMLETIDYVLEHPSPDSFLLMWSA